LKGAIPKKKGLGHLLYDPGEARPMPAKKKKKGNDVSGGGGGRELSRKVGGVSKANRPGKKKGCLKEKKGVAGRKWLSWGKNHLRTRGRGEKKRAELMKNSAVWPGKIILSEVGGTGEPRGRR